MAVNKNDSLRDRTWTTAEGRNIKLRDMDTNHVHNCLNHIRKRIQREIETTLKSGKHLRVRIAKAEAVANTLKDIKGAIGSDLAMEIKSNLEQEYNNQSPATQERINLELVDDLPYQALLYEISAREKDAQAKIKEALETDQENFFDSKGKVLVDKIKLKPQDVPMILECTADSTISRNVKTGDYFGINDDLFRITYIVRRAQQSSNNDILELTLNSRREAEKNLVLKAVQEGEHYDVY
jgi:GH24 family phage-related lysozyme (muramidase)